ncbi:BamA/TamA family outer membrane protein [candidate division KSB1 bacterium]|nr:BamA/TamA family outer membrane protein [candidate division KSB1 bacterium]
MQKQLLKIIAVFCTILFLKPVIPAATDSTQLYIDTFRFKGNTFFNKNRLENHLNPQNHRPLPVSNIEQLIDALLQLYKDHDVTNMQIDSVATKTGTSDSTIMLDFHVSENEKFRLTCIDIHCNNPQQRKFLESLIDLRTDVSPPQQLIFHIEKFLDHLENNGYPFSRITVDSIRILEQASVEAFLTADTGPLVRIENIRIRGNKTTRESVILREIRIDPGEIYEQAKVSKIRKRLLKLGYFREIDEPRIILNSQGKGELIIEVEEGNMNNVDGVAGYNPASQNNQSGYFTGLIDISLANLMGTGRQIDAFWEKKDRKSQQLRFRYLEPWILGQPLHIGVSFQQLIQDTSFIKRNWTFDINYDFSENVVLFTNLGREEISPDSLGRVIWNLSESRSLLVNLGIRYDTRDDLINPRTGLFYQTTVEFSRKKIVQPAPGSLQESEPQSSFDRKRLAMDMELLLPLFKWQVISLALHGRQITSDEAEIPISDLFRFGGSRTLRGYREDELWGEKIAWFNAEYRYLLSQRSRAFVFLDGGYHTRTTITSGKQEGYNLGYGIGFRIDTRLGLIGLDYGLSEGRSLSNGLVHVRLVNKF